MCGIMGMIGSESVSKEIFLGMLNLQHRGQDSAGILTYDGVNFHLKKGPGLVEDVFDEKALDDLKGYAGIGHTRYPTVGKGIDAQPFLINHPYGIGMAHNGNVINYYQLKSSLKEERFRILTSDCDLETILNIFADELSMQLNRKVSFHDAVFDSVRAVHEKVIGGYSVVSVIGDRGLLAFKDPHGLMPMVIGERLDNGKKTHAVASESIALQSLGFDDINEIKAGEAILIDQDSNVHSAILSNKSCTPCMFQWVYFARPESEIDRRPVYTARLNLGRELAKKLKGIEADYIVPVPDTSRTIAITLAEELGIPYREGLIKNNYIGRTFIMASQKKRENAVNLKLNLVHSQISGKDIILVDDSIVRGTTSKKIVKLVRGAGAKKIYFVSACPPLKFPCYYGVDFPDKTELIAFEKSIDEIKDELGVDELFYQDIEGLMSAIEQPMCNACLTGNYPTDVSSGGEFKKMRVEDRK